MGSGGRPATSRNGAAIELTCLLYSALDIWDDPTSSCRSTELKTRISKNFRNSFFDKYYYNDVCGGPQNRPNQFIGMTIAKELFSKTDKETVIETALSEKMLGKLGMATLSPADVCYDPYYDGGDNYHQGPEFSIRKK